MLDWERLKIIKWIHMIILQTMVENKIEFDRLESGKALTSSTIADNQLFDCPTLLWKSQLCMIRLFGAKALPLHILLILHIWHNSITSIFSISIQVYVTMLLLISIANIRKYSRLAKKLAWQQELQFLSRAIF